MLERVLGPISVRTTAAGDSGAPLTTIVQLKVAVAETESVTLPTNENVPLVVGVPLIRPVDELGPVRPAGRLPLASENVYAGVPPDAINDAE